MQITYNLLNLPERVQANGVTVASYSYLADGSKYSVEDTNGNGYVYTGSLTYSKNPLDLSGGEEFYGADFAGGKILSASQGRSFQPVYYTTDHLGSIRVITNANGVVKEQNDYYPYGGRHTSGNIYALLPGNNHKFNGKEEQTTGNLGYLDYGARMYDNVTGRWGTPDPLAEKYKSMSPYNYCLNNPVKFVDPDGKDVWEMDYMARVRWVAESKMHTMYALGKDGARTGQSITVNDRSIFDGLAATGKESGYNASYVYGNPSELASVFLFGADNTNAEWRFSRYDTGSGDQYAIGTIHKNALAISPEQMGFGRVSEIAFIHSHPNQYGTRVDEYESMGWARLSNIEANFMNDNRGSLSISGDSRNVYRNVNNYPSNANYLTYFPYTGNIYQVRGAQHPSFIRNIRKHNYNPNRLFWGVLNGR